METLADVLRQAPMKKQIGGSIEWFGLNVRVPPGYRVVLVPNDDVMDAEDRAGVRGRRKGVVYNSRWKAPLVAAA